MSFMLNRKTHKQRYRTFFDNARIVNRKTMGAFYVKNYDFIARKNKQLRIVTIISSTVGSLQGFKIVSYVNTVLVKDHVIVQGNILKSPVSFGKVNKWKRIR